MTMKYETMEVNETFHGITITMNKPEKGNPINNTLLAEINRVLDLAEKDPNTRVVVLESQGGVFCTGLDFEEVAQAGETAAHQQSNPYMQTLKRFTLTPKVIISVVDGQAMAGGVGFAAASDLAIATSKSRFGVSEALWGLLPAVVTPFLIRRVGFQAAYRMALTTMPISAQQAYEIHLIDEISDTPGECVRQFWLRLSKLEESTITNLKHYFRKMWLITEQMEETAVSEIRRLLAQPKVLQDITNYVKYRKFPWE